MSPETVPQGERKRRSTSIPFLIGVSILGVVGYFAGPTIMTYAMVLQERWILYDNAAKDMRKPRPAGATDGPSVGGMKPPAENESGPPPEGPGGGAPADAGPSGGGSGGAGPGGFDPEAIFAQRDTDGNGIIENAEVSERMQKQIAEWDKDKDGGLSKEEFLEGMKSRIGAGRPSAEGSSDNKTAPETTTPK